MRELRQFILVSFAAFFALNGCGSAGNGGSKGFSADQNASVPPRSTDASTLPRYPIVYVHGLMDGGRDTLKSFLSDVEAESGATIYRPEISPANSVEFRAEQLAAEVEQILAATGALKINIVAHSLGGLDARYMISSLGYNDRVASLTTIATPHQGTPLTGLAEALGADQFAELINTVFAWSGKILNDESSPETVDFLAALESLSEDYVQNTFNPENPNQPGVYYQSWAGVSGLGSSHKIKLVLGLSNSYLKLVRGNNDGLVPVESAKWGDYRGRLLADHLDTSGRDLGFLGGDGFDYITFFKTMMEELRVKGY